MSNRTGLSRGTLADTRGSVEAIGGWSRRRRCDPRRWEQHRPGWASRRWRRSNGLSCRHRWNPGASGEAGVGARVVTGIVSRILVDTIHSPRREVRISVGAVEHAIHGDVGEHPEVGVEVPAAAVPASSRIAHVLGGRDVRDGTIIGTALAPGA